MTEANTDPNTGNSEGVKPEIKTTEDTTPVKVGGVFDVEDTKIVAPQDWPNDWREKQASAYVGKNEGEEYTKEMKRLQRFNSPLDLHKSYRELEKKASSIKQAPELPNDATPEQVAEYRKAAGIPDKADGYMDHVKDMKIDDNLKPLVGKFFEDMHGKNASPEVVKNSLQSYFAIAEAQAQARLEADETAKVQSRSELQSEWGGEYKSNFNAIAGLMDQYPNLKAAFSMARKEDGTPVGYDANVMRDLAMLSRELNPLHTIVTSGQGDKAKLVSDEISNLKGMMGSPESEYWRGPNAEKNQARYRELMQKTQAKK